MIIAITTVTVLIACTLGAIVGFGGGVIIKPVLDSIGFCTVDVVNFISSCGVLAMSISSILRHIKQKTQFDKRIALLVSFGAVAGGFCGSSLFKLALSGIDEGVLKALQAGIIILFVGFGVYYVNKKNPKTLHLTNPVAMLGTGLLLGTLNSFLGIGGGPINVTFLLLMFSLAVKDSAVYSICIVFFCQTSNLITQFCSNQFAPYKEYYPIVLCAMVAAVVGGIVGSTINKKASDKTVRLLFSLVMLFVFGINVLNVIKGIM